MQNLIIIIYFVDRNQTVLQRSKPNSCTKLINEQLVP